jgi:hypothetical protein
MADVANPEAAVRNYLNFLSDPGSLVDAKLVSELEGKVSASKDPVDRLLAIAALDRAKTADPEVYEKAFVSQAKLWADKKNVPAGAFEKLGVPRDVLQAAGFLGRLTRRAGRGVRRASPVVAPIARRPAIKADALEASILQLAEPFTVKDVSEKVGGSLIEVKAAIDRLEAQGRIVPAGERRGQRGRASKTWTPSTA